MPYLPIPTLPKFIAGHKLYLHALLIPVVYKNISVHYKTLDIYWEIERRLSLER